MYRQACGEKKQIILSTRGFGDPVAAQSFFIIISDHEQGLYVYVCICSRSRCAVVFDLFV